VVSIPATQAARTTLARMRPCREHRWYRFGANTAPPLLLERFGIAQCDTVMGADIKEIAVPPVIEEVPEQEILAVLAIIPIAHWDTFSILCL